MEFYKKEGSGFGPFENKLKYVIHFHEDVRCGLSTVVLPSEVALEIKLVWRNFDLAMSMTPRIRVEVFAPTSVVGL